MGRLGITYLDVEKAADLLKNQSKNPTVDAVRAVLGTGSKSTIVPYLKRWRSTQTEGVGSIRSLQTSQEDQEGSHPLLTSPKFLALAKELYDHLQVGAEAQIKILKKELSELQENLSHTEKDRFFLRQQKVALKTALKKLKSEVIDQKN